MTMVNRSGKGRTIDGEAAFDIWLDTGSLVKTAPRYTREIGVSPKSGKPHNVSALWGALWRWALENPDVAKEKIIVKRKEWGVYPMSEDELNEELVKHATKIYKNNREKFMHWVDRNEFEKYKYVYEGFLIKNFGG